MEIANGISAYVALGIKGFDFFQSSDAPRVGKGKGRTRLNLISIQADKAGVHLVLVTGKKVVRPHLFEGEVHRRHRRCRCRSPPRNAD